MLKFSGLQVVASRVALVAVVVASSWATATSARAEGKPVFVVSFAGYDALVNDLKFIGDVSGGPQMAQSFEGLVAFATGMQGPIGLEKGKPLGLAVTVDETDVRRRFLFVPVSDVDKLLGAIQGFVPKVEDQGDGLLRLKPNFGPPLYLRKTDGWAYLSTHAEHLTEVPADPLKLLGDLPSQYDLAGRLFVQNLPREHVDAALRVLEAAGAPGMRRVEGEDEATHAARVKLAQLFVGQLGKFFDEVDVVTVGLRIDGATRNARIDGILSARAGGDLAKKFQAASSGATASKFAGFVDPAAVAGLHWQTPLMEEDRALLLDAVEEARKLAVKRIDGEPRFLDPTNRQAAQEMASQVFDVAEATIRGGQIHGAAAMVGDGPFHVVAGALLVDAPTLNAVFKRAVDLWGSRPGLPPVKLNVADKENIEFHTMTFSGVGGDLKHVFGDELTVAVGFGADRVLLAAGATPIDVATGMSAKSSAGGAVLPPATAKIQVAPLARLINDEQRKADPRLVDLLGQAEKDDVELTTTVSPQEVRVQIDIAEGVLGAFGRAAMLGLQRR